MPAKVLDSFALIAYFRDEPGAETMENLLVTAGKRDSPLHMTDWPTPSPPPWPKRTRPNSSPAIRTIQHSHQTPTAAGRTDLALHEPSPPVAAGAIFVPADLRELNVADLPLSVRLEGVLQRRGARRLADLHRVALRDLRRTRNCGRKTISELVRLIERAAAGEFCAAPDVAWNPVEVVRTLDALIVDVPDRNEEITMPIPTSTPTTPKDSDLSNSRRGQLTCRRGKCAISHP